MQLRIARLRKYPIDPKAYLGCCESDENLHLQVPLYAKSCYLATFIGFSPLFKCLVQLV